MNKDITLPYELATKDLTLQEIGAVFTMFATQKMTEKEVERWAKDDEYLSTVESVLEKEYVNLKYDENDNPILDIDLTEKPFWELEDYDENDNPIYSHPSYFGEEEGCSPWYYKIKPILRDMKTVWVDCSDKDLFTFRHVDYESLEEAEETYVELLNGQLEEIKNLEEIEKSSNE